MYLKGLVWPASHTSTSAPYVNLSLWFVINEASLMNRV